MGRPRIALALHGADDEDALAVLRDLERLALQEHALDAPALERAARVASDLRMRSLLGPGAVLIWTVEADSWEEAQTMRHEFLGWKPYKPMA